MTEDAGEPGVMVLVPGPADGYVDTHPTGRKIQIQDGHLRVIGSNGKVFGDGDIAIYAPGQWVKAKLGNSTTWDEPGS